MKIWDSVYIFSEECLVTILMKSRQYCVPFYISLIPTFLSLDLSSFTDWPCSHSTQQLSEMASNHRHKTSTNDRRSIPRGPIPTMRRTNQSKRSTVWHGTKCRWISRSCVGAPCRHVWHRFWAESRFKSFSRVVSTKWIHSRFNDIDEMSERQSRLGGW